MKTGKEMSKERRKGKKDEKIREEEERKGERKEQGVRKREAKNGEKRRV